MRGRCRPLGHLRLQGVVLPAVVVAACAPAPVAELDLAARWNDGLNTTEVALIDVGSPGSEAFLGSGWYYPERRPKTGETFIWSRGDVSEVLFHIGWRRPLQMAIYGSPIRAPGIEHGAYDFELNGHSIGSAVRPEHGVLTLDLPAAAQLCGRNRLTIRWGRTVAPATVIEGSTDARELAFACTRIVLQPVDTATIAADGEVVALPAGAVSDLFFDLDGRSRFRVDSCERVDGAAFVTVEIRREGEDTAIIEDYDCNGSPFDLAFTAAGLTRIRVSVRPEDPTAPPTGVRLFRPHLRAARSPANGASVASPPRSAGITESRRRPNVVVYLVDALRADRIGAYGCERPLTPRLDAMAHEGVVFEDVTAQSSWTKAAVASIFTGLWPREHGVNGPDDRLPDQLRTLPEYLRAAGYRTGAVVANAYVGTQFGFGRGFDHFEYLEHRLGRSDIIHDRVADWLAEVSGDRSPFFLYVHAIDPHAPYAPPQPYRERFAPTVSDPSVGEVETVRGLVLGSVSPTAALERDLRDLYDAEVAANDDSFGRLLDLLTDLGELDDTIVIFTSDHGEAFGEHGSWTHGLDLYNEVLDIPLIVRLPDAAAAGARVSEPAQHIDLLPSILARCGAPVEKELPGAVLFDVVGPVAPAASRAVYAYLDYWGRTGAAVILDGWKLIRPLSSEFGADIELYHRASDRCERRDLGTESPVRKGWLEASLAVALRARGAGVRTEIDERTRRQLEALGYLTQTTHE